MSLDTEEGEKEEGEDQGTETAWCSLRLGLSFFVKTLGVGCWVFGEETGQYWDIIFTSDLALVHFNLVSAFRLCFFVFQ